MMAIDYQSIAKIETAEVALADRYLDLVAAHHHGDGA
jgi:hypothetical protein